MMHGQNHIKSVIVCLEYFGRHIRASAQGQIMVCNLRLEIRGEVGATSLFNPLAPEFPFKF